MVLRLFGLKDSELKARPTRTASPPSDAPLVAIRRPVMRDAGTSPTKPASAKPKAGRAAKPKTAAPRRRATR